MERFVVVQENETWLVSHKDERLYTYLTREEAERAALALANNAVENGTPATMIIMPATAVTQRHAVVPSERNAT